MCGHEDAFFKPMELLNFMIWIIVLSYYEWTDYSMCNNYL